MVKSENKKMNIWLQLLLYVIIAVSLVLVCFKVFDLSSSNYGLFTSVYEWIQLGVLLGISFWSIK